MYKSYDNEIMTTFMPCQSKTEKSERRIMTMNKEAKKPKGFYVEKGNFFVHAAIVLLAISMAFRLLGTLSLWGDMFALATQIVLPLVCSLLFILFALVFGRIALWTTILPVLGGAAFFILSATSGNEQLKMIICIAIAFAAAFVYTATLAGMIRTKWLNVIVFALVLAYQIVFLAIPAFSDAENPVSFAGGMTLLSSIGIILAMFCFSLAVRRAKPPKENPDLPKIKDPVVIAPEQPVLPEETPETAAESAEESTEPVDAAARTIPEEESCVEAPQAEEPLAEEPVSEKETEEKDDDIQA